MNTLTKQVEFSQLRHAYTTVKQWVEAEATCLIPSLHTAIAKDLGLYGDDNHELVVKFVDQFKLDYQAFDYEKHFQTEGELFGSSASFFTLLSLVVWLLVKVVELLTLNKLKFKTTDLGWPERDVTDLTLKDLITWYIEGEYANGNDVRYVVKDNNL